MEQIRQSTLDFLSDLKLHNDRDWFLSNRTGYDDARTNFESFVQALIDDIEIFDPMLKDLEAKSCMYRINRDIRFSNDKTLYKTHLGAFIVRGGKNNGNRLAGYYFHVEPGGNSMIAGGAYIPPTPWLSAIREKISEEGERFLKIITAREFVNLFGELDGEKLKTAPKGYPRDHPYIELLRMKSFLAVRMLSDKEIVSPGCLSFVAGAAKSIKPLNDFLNEY